MGTLPPESEAAASSWKVVTQTAVAVLLRDAWPLPVEEKSPSWTPGRKEHPAMVALWEQRTKKNEWKMNECKKWGLLVNVQK